MHTLPGTNVDRAPSRVPLTCGGERAPTGAKRRPAKKKVGHPGDCRRDARREGNDKRQEFYSRRMVARRSASSGKTRPVCKQSKM
jgi:hypothetical protein